MRKVIARRLNRGEVDDPAFLLTLDCELDALLALREQINKGAPLTDGKPAYKLSVNDMIIKALAMACAPFRMPMSPGPMARCSSTSTPISASPCRSPAASYPVVRDACHKPLSVISTR